jgi:hypothetical protein
MKKDKEKKLEISYAMRLLKEKYRVRISSIWSGETKGICKLTGQDMMIRILNKPTRRNLKT